MPKLPFKKNSNDTVYLIAGRIRGFVPSPRIFVRKGT